MADRRPAASGATAGLFLLSALVLCTGVGLVAGWAAGHPLVGAAIGFAIAVPVSFYLVYRQYRDI
jgi:hypothetical protein